MEYTTVIINGQPYHIIGRTQDELDTEAARMQEERTVSFPCAWCGSPVVTGGIEQDGQHYCNEECAKWENALSCGILPTGGQSAGFDTSEPY